MLDLIRLARVHQWSKSVFVLIGPMYALVDNPPTDEGRLGQYIVSALGAALAFALAASGCYVINDLRDREADREHPRKRNRPIAAGRVSAGTAVVFALALWASALGLSALLTQAAASWWLLLAVAFYIANTTAYSMGLKTKAIADVMSLAMGFVVRVIGGCVAVGVMASDWLVTCSFFLAMFLAFGKRLGERRTLSGEALVASRQVQMIYTDELLRLAVIGVGIAALVTYAGYVQGRADAFTVNGVNLLWPTMLPVTYGILRAIVLLELGKYDDPTELALRDRAMQVTTLLFVATSGAAYLWA